MSADEVVQAYDSLSPAYHRAFEVFLAHTDQKTTAHDWLKGLVQSLPRRGVLVDAGAGNGKVTTWFVGDFQRTIAIEPNPSLCEELRRTCPTAQTLPQTILEAQPPAPADLVLCSHVLYYIPDAQWIAHLEKFVSWLAPDGMLVIVLQNHDTECMRLLEHFHGRRFQLSELARRFEAQHGRDYRVEIATVAAQVKTADFESAYIVAEFMLNLLPLPQPPRRSLEDYVRRHFADPAGGFRFSCDQDFLTIRRRP
jgi:trans-aconitate methyltransferase